MEMHVVEFPGLGGLELSINTVAFQVFGISIYWYGIIIAFGFMLAVVLALRDSKNHGIEPESIIDLVLFAAPAAIICARLFYVIFSWDNYRDDLREIINIRNGGLAIYGGVIGAMITAWIFARVRKIRPLKLLDFAVPYLALGQAIGRWGNFVNQEAFGTNTTLPWGMTSDRIRSDLGVLQMQGVNVDPALPVHPTFLYESLWNLAAFFILLWFRKKKKLEGEVVFLYMIIYGAGRTWIEALRTDSLMLGNLRISQLLALIFAITFTTLIYLRRKKLANAEDEKVEIGSSSYGELLKKIKEEESVLPAAAGAVNMKAEDGAEVPEAADEAGKTEPETKSPPPDEA
jgi:phosphatidylglycerol---prolipoprotein diacylglyceryl transferase